MYVKGSRIIRRIAVIQRGLLVERITVYQITHDPPPIDEPKSRKCTATPAHVATKNFDTEV